MVKKNVTAWSALTITMVLALLLLAYVIQRVTHEYALERLTDRSENVTAIAKQSLQSELVKFELIPVLLSENPYLQNALATHGEDSIANLNQKLDELAQQTGATYIFAVGPDGVTIASSNHSTMESFVGRSYEFRPYFQSAMQTGSGRYYFAKGERTGIGGLFLASRVDVADETLGIIVVKVEFQHLVESWREDDATTFVTDKDGIILFSSDPSLDYSTLRPLSDQKREEIARSMQFGAAPLEQVPFMIQDQTAVSTINGDKSILTFRDIRNLDWSLFRLERVQPTLNDANARIHLFWFIASVIVIAAILFIHWRRKQREDNLRYLERLEREVAERTEALSHSNQQLELEIDHRERINTKYRSAREELAQANRLGSIGAVTANVAHEVNQPLAAIKAFATNSKTYLKRGNTEQVEHNLGSIVDLSDRLAAITAELRRYSRHSSSKLETIKLSDVLEGVDLLIGDKIRKDGVQLTIPSDEAKQLKVFGGRIRLEQVLVNLLNNGLDAVAHAEDPQILIDIQTTDKSVFITVEDNGHGVEAEIRSNIFNPFVTTKTDGVGIGLGIARNIMEEFNGQLELIEPKKLKGAAFRLQLAKR